MYQVDIINSEMPSYATTSQFRLCKKKYVQGLGIFFSIHIRWMNIQNNADKNKFAGNLFMLRITMSKSFELKRTERKKNVHVQRVHVVNVLFSFLLSYWAYYVERIAWASVTLSLWAIFEPKHTTWSKVAINIENITGSWAFETESMYGAGERGCYEP